MIQTIARYLFLFCFLFFSSLEASTPMSIMLEAKIATQERGNLAGNYHVVIDIIGTKPNLEGVSQQWSQNFPSVTFTNGLCYIVLGTDPSNPLSPDVFDVGDPNFRITVYIDGDALQSQFPIPSTPYAIQAKVADTVLAVSANRIEGNFTSTVNIEADLLVDSGTLFVDSSENKVGIGTLTPSSRLDVAGTVNAQAFTIDGKNLESQLSWRKYGPNLAYLSGKVGIATQNPNYSLDVVGTVNASEYRVNGVLLEDYLSQALAWKVAVDNTNDIYFNDGSYTGSLGVGVSQNITERLTIAGALKLGLSIQGVPEAGTIEYDKTNRDFFGYTSKNTRKSLTGIRVEGAPDPNQIVIWSSDSNVQAAEHLVWKNNRLGIGTDDPQAQLDIKPIANSAPIVNIQGSNGESVFYISESGRVGIGTQTPTNSLHVAGAIDATDYFIDGERLQGTFSEGSFWYQGNNNQIFYDIGNVGIGTQSPRNLLELSAATDNVAMTFDLQGTDLFTIGVDASVEDAFVISQGSDLSQPVFVFSGNKIGVGIKDPLANLHVSGNAGFLVTGEFGQGDALAASGKGVRMFFYPKKAAFRAGYVLNNRWDDEQIGIYSSALGYDSQASGAYSASIGGFKNRITGDYAGIIGGFENQADADYSFVAGHKAQTGPGATGSFVWADYTPTAAPFISTIPNQFLIRANGGVGIGTTDTEGSVLALHRDYPGHYLLTMGATGVTQDTVAVSTKGTVGIGTAAPSQAKLAVMGGSVGIGTTNPDALFSISSDQASGYMMKVDNPSISTTRSMMVITAEGNIGIGVDNPQERLDVGSGSIRATSFLLVDPDDPTSFVILQPSSGSPWSDPSDPETGNGNTYRSMGFVGIGTPSPNSLLELSNRNEAAAPPVITFDLYDVQTGEGTDYFSMGLVTRNEMVYFAIQPGGSIDKDGAVFVASSGGIGIGMGAQTPSADLHVSGNTVFSGKVSIATENVSHNYDLYVDGTFNVDTLSIGGVVWNPAQTPWKTNESPVSIYYASGNVGIGTNDPQSRLEVLGAVSANSLTVRDQVELKGNVVTTFLKLQDTTTEDVRLGELKLQGNDLIFQNPVGGSKVLSSPIQKSDAKVSGPLAFWINSTTIGKVPVFWDTEKSELSVTGNLSLKGYAVDDNGLSISTNVGVAKDTGFAMVSQIDHKGLLSEIKGYTGQHVDVSILRDWGKPDEAIFVKGIDVSMGGTGTILNNASVVGLMVDVSDLKVDSGSSARKHAALFLGGNVGIGTNSPDPSVALEVNGVVSANFVELSNGIDVSQLLVNKENKGFVVNRDEGTLEPRVGIGTLDPSAELEVVGLVSVNAVQVLGGISAATMNIGNGHFFVSASGNIGLGTTDPQSSLDLNKVIDGTVDKSFVSEKIDISIAGTESDSFTFEYDQNLTGLDVTLRSEANNKLASDAEALGLKVDMTGLQSNSTETKIVGLDVDVQSSDPNEIRYAALFMGGYVGIGTAEPTASLHVKGDIHADQLFLEEGIITNRATFNTLIVNNVASMNSVTLNNLAVLGSISANILSIESALTVPDATFTTLNTVQSTVSGKLEASTVNVLETFMAKRGHFSQSLGVGLPAPETGLAVSGNISADSLTLTDALVLTGSAVLNVNDGVLYASDYVGIGTKTPTAPLHVVYSSDSYRAYDPTDSHSWNAIRIQTSSDIPGVAAGLLFVPDAGVPSASIGSGIVAVRSSSGTGSDLAFISDPEDGVPVEGMRMSATGFLGIGKTDPSAQLDVAGNAFFDGDVTINGTLFVSGITANSVVTINPNGKLVVEGMTSFNSAVLLKQGLYLNESTDPEEKAGYGTLFVNTDGNLIFRDSAGVSQNLSAAFAGQPNLIPFFDENGNLKNDSILQWDNTTKTFRVGTQEAQAVVEVVATINDSLTTDMSLQKVNMTIADRSGLGSGSALTGLDITFQSSPLSSDDPVNFGRLANGETAVGLTVDLRDLVAKSGQDSGTDSGYKYAGVFMGGNVGVGIDKPQAALHIGPDLDTGAFRVDTQYTQSGQPVDVDYALFVSATGNVGVGVSNPNAKLTISTDPFSDVQGSVFQIVSGNKTLLVVKNDGQVGIGIDSPTEKLEIAGTVSANQGLFSGVSATTLNVGQGAFVINQLGDIGIGTQTPDGNLAFSKTLSTSGGDPFFSQKMDLLISGATGASNPFYFNQDVTGMQISIQSNSAADALAGGQSAVGVSINMENLYDGSNPAQVVGLDVNVGQGESRYAALFLGGHVGIGTANPTQALTVSGNILATGLDLSGDMTADFVTMNGLFVAGGVTINGRLLVGDLEADTISVNNILVNGELEISTASFKVVTVDSVAIFNKVGVGVPAADITEALVVSGDTKLMGHLDLLGTMNVSAIYSDKTITVNLTTGNTMIVDGIVSTNSDVKVGGALVFATDTTLDSGSSLGQLYVQNSSLYFSRGNGSPAVDLAGAFVGIENRIPYFSPSGLSYDTFLEWDGSNNTFTVGTTNADALTRMEVIASINESISNDVSVQKIHFDVGKRTGASSARIIGLDIDMQSSPLLADNAFDFGRIADGETAIGLHVDMTQLEAKYSDQTQGGNPYKGYKYAAAFRGGNVGVGMPTPRAALHIRSEEASLPAFIIDSVYDDNGTAQTVENALFVSNTGQVGLGTDSPTALLTISKGDTASHLLDIRDGDSPFLRVNASGLVGVHVPTPSYALDVSGNFRVGSSAESSTLVVSTNVGVGTDTPSSKLHIVGDLRVDSSSRSHALYVDKTSGYVGVNTDSPSHALSVQGVLESIKADGALVSTVVQDTDDLGFLARTTKNYTYFGLKKESSGAYNPVVSWGPDVSDILAFDYYNGSVSHNVMAMHPASGGESKIGIGLDTLIPSASLHVSGNFMVQNESGPVFFVSSGNVGIATDSPAASLDVKGTLTAEELTIIAGEVSVSTLNISDSLKITKTLTSNVSAKSVGHQVEVIVSADVGSELVGLDISVKGATNTQYNRPYTIFNSTAYGLKVDVSDLLVKNPTFNDPQKGTKYAAVFTGGNVGIGTTRPEATLHVNAASKATIARFGTSSSELSISDKENGQIAFQVKNVATQGADSEVLVLAPNKVGIGTVPDSTDTAALVVNGDTRLGVITEGDAENPSSDDDRYGAKLFFSGGPRLKAGIDSDNRDNLYIARYNAAADQSELRVNFSTLSQSLVSPDLPGDFETGSSVTPNGKDKFSIGFTKDGAYNSVFQVHNNGNVGIANGISTSFIPNNLLHVKGSTSGLASDTKSHLVMIENTSSEASNSLALLHSGATGSNSITEAHNFVTFMVGGSVVGEIEGNNGSLGVDGGVRYKTGGGDYAEYLRKKQRNEVIEKGDIVGVDNEGKISKNLADAQQFLVKSTSAAVAGNWPGDDKEGYELIAFFGQVKVKVRGVVNKGDYIIPSGYNDGTGIAVSASERLDRHVMNQIVGRAWESSDELGVKQIHTAVGFGFSAPSLQEEAALLRDLEREFQALKEEKEAMMNAFEEKLEAQNKEIKAIMEGLSTTSQ